MLSVTTILDYFTEPELLAWYLKNGKAKCEQIGNEAKKIGNRTDTLIQVNLKELAYTMPAVNPDPTDVSVSNCLAGWEAFKFDHPEFCPSVVSCQIELQVGELVGHPDFELQQKRGWGIVDLKTSKQIQPKHWTQVVQYAWMQQQIRGCEKAAFVGILRLDKNEAGAYQYQELTSLEDFVYENKVFEAYLTAYQHAQKVRERVRAILEQEVLDVS